MSEREFFPDGTPIQNWFYDIESPSIETLGAKYVITDYGVKDDRKVYTQEIQSLIDHVSKNGGGCIVVPAGTYYTGALFFKQGVHLFISPDGILKGSDDISDYPLCQTRIEGESCLYFPALINADGVDGFTLFGEGTIDGNGLKAWKAFWLRVKWNRNFTNKDEQRPRLVYISNSKNVTIANLHLQNSHFWTNHIYKCAHVKFLNCKIFAPKTPVPAPSSDAIDIDVCHDVLIKNCYMEVNDDAVVLKGGKGPYADTLAENGTNERILVEDCVFKNCHGSLTCGSESIHNRNVLVRRIQVENVSNLLWLKMRPDTPQRYEYIMLEKVQGSILSFLNTHAWTQFFDLKGRKDIPISYVENITFKDCNCECNIFFDVEPSAEQYRLSNFELKNLQIRAKQFGSPIDVIKKIKTECVDVQTERP